MEILKSIVSLLAGVGVFIAGMNMLGNGLERSAGKGMKNLLGRISGNRFAGVGIGAAVTAVIQSSAATSIMAIGFVNAGIMSLYQATAIIMGANIGTTVTGIIVSLKSLSISFYASLLAFIGVMMTFIKSEKVKQIGGILCGLGLIFIGLDIMSGAFGDKDSAINLMFSNLFQKISFPLLLILCGTVFTALIQSSSVATGVVIIMVGSGALTIENALFIILGSNIGTCITAILAAMGTTTNAKRTALIHLTFNVVGTVVFTVFLWFFEDWFINILQSLISSPEMQIAWFHVIFNVITTAMLLPFIKQLVKFSEIVIKDKPTEKQRQLKYLDDRLLKTPSIALAQIKKEVEYMALLSKENIEKSFAELINKTGEYANDIVENEAIIDFTNKELTEYLIKLTSLVDGSDEKVIGSYFHVLNDIERIGDHAENFYDIAVQMENEEISFSQSALDDIKVMYDSVYKMFDIALDAFDHNVKTNLAEIDELEENVDGLKKSLSENHFARLSKGECKTELSAYYFSVLAGYERVADHLVNVGYSIVNPTGDQI